MFPLRLLLWWAALAVCEIVWVAAMAAAPVAMDFMAVLRGSGEFMRSVDYVRISLTLAKSFVL